MKWVPLNSTTPTDAVTPAPKTGASVRPELLDALGEQETGGESDPDKAVSVKGAKGRYQITDPTARAFGFDPAKLGDRDYSRNAAATILGKDIELAKGDEREGLKSYYGRGTPPKGHPTADEYADSVLKRAGASPAASKSAPSFRWVPTSGLEGPTEMRAAPSPVQRVGEEAARIGGLAGGAALGGPVGAGLGGTAADLGIALLHHFLYGTPINIHAPDILKHPLDREARARFIGLNDEDIQRLRESGYLPKESTLGPQQPSRLQADVMENLAGAYGGEVTGPALTGMGVKIGRAAVGAPELEAGAKETFAEASAKREAASSKQAAANLKERTEVYESAQAKAAKEQQAAQVEAEKQQATATAAKQKFTEQHAKVQQETTEQIGKLRDKAVKEQTPGAQQAAVTSATGRTPEVSARQLAEPAQASIGRKQQFYQTIREPLRRFSDRWAMNRDHLLAGQANSPVNFDPLMESVNTQEAWAKANNKDFGAPLNKLFTKIRNLVPAGKLDLATMLKGKGKGAAPLSNEDWARLQAQMEGGEGSLAANVRGMLGIRSEASRIADASSGPTRTAARSIVDGVDASLAKDPQLNAKLPGLAKLNAQWRHHKEVFGDLQDKVGDVTIPTDIGKEMFDKPRVALEWAQMATPQERTAAKKLYGDWVNNQLREGKNLDQIISPSHADFMKILAPGTPFASEEGIRRITAKTMALEDLIQSSPEVQQKFMQSFLPVARRQTEAGMNEVTREAIAQAQKMGPIGQQIIKGIESARTPADKFSVAVQAMTGTTPEKIAVGAVETSPEQAMQATMAAQKTPEAAGREAIAGMFPNRPVPPTTPEEAAIASLQEGNLGKARNASYFIERTKKMWPIYAGIAAMGAASGRVVTYSGVMLGLGLGTAAITPIKRAFAKSLENPENARAFWNALNNPAAPSAMGTIAQTAANAILSDAGAQALKSGTGVSLEGETPKVEAGPGVKAVEKSRAEHLAPTPSASDRAEKVSADLGKGKTPEVHADLGRGRLSSDEVDKLLKTASRKDAMAILAHVPLTEALDAAEVANDDERKMLLPLIAQKMREQFKDQKYNKTLAVSLAKRFNTLQSGGANGADSQRATA